MNNSLKSSLSEIDDFIKKFKNQKKYSLIMLNLIMMIKNIIECLNSSYVSTHGKKQKSLKINFQKY